MRSVVFTVCCLIVHHINPPPLLTIQYTWAVKMALSSSGGHYCAENYPYIGQADGAFENLQFLVRGCRRLDPPLEGPSMPLTFISFTAVEVCVSVSKKYYWFMI